jgi:hypothetical protein
LEALAEGFGGKVRLWKERSEPLLARERRVYLLALQDAIAGADAARVVLAAALARIERELTPPTAMTRGADRPDPCTAQFLHPTTPAGRVF